MSNINLKMTTMKVSRLRALPSTKRVLCIQEIVVIRWFSNLTSSNSQWYQMFSYTTRSSHCTFAFAMVI
ncbi:hypothetical protein BC829DRAFT_392762, partial [Chytridium lagenaria]